MAIKKNNKLIGWHSKLSGRFSKMLQIDYGSGLLGEWGLTDKVPESKKKSNRV